MPNPVAILKYLREEIDLSVIAPKGSLDITDPTVRDNINASLGIATNESFITPYIALERVRKVVAPYHIFIPAYTFLEGAAGTAVFEVSQFGHKAGQTNDGKFIDGTEPDKDLTHGPHIEGEINHEPPGIVLDTDPDPEFHLYFEYRLNEKGTFDIFCEIVHDDELDEIQNDMEEEDDDIE